MARRRSPGRGFNLRVGTETEHSVIKAIQFAAPWAIWAIGMPLMAGALLLAKKFWGHPQVMNLSMGASTVILTWLIWKVTASRKGYFRYHPAINMVGGMGWLWSMVAFHPNGLHGIAWLIGGGAACLGWTVRTSSQGDPIHDIGAATVITVAKGGGGGDGGRSGPRVVDMGYVARAVAGRAPVVRTMLEGAGKVVPVLKRPWETPALEKGSTPVTEPEDGGDKPPTNDVLPGEIMGVDPKPIYQMIASNWRRFTTQMESGRQLNGAKLHPLKLTSTRIKTEVRLRPGHQEPKLVEDVRGLLASLNHLPPTSVIPLPNPRDFSKVYLDFVIQDVLAKTRTWSGPNGAWTKNAKSGLWEKTGKPQWTSIGQKAIQFGLYEDGVLAEIFQPASKKLDKTLSHVAFEGMNGSGKSNVARLAVTAGVLMYDVVDWVIDPKKAEQTMGCASGALEWFAITEAEAVDLINFVVRLITAKARYLGELGFDEWEPGCGLPFHRIWIEEGNLVAGLLGSDMEDAANLARSAGVAINGSFQRMHHESVPTGFRAAFPESMSFGVTKLADAFILPDELSDAGCDPSQWKNHQKGKLYWNSAAVELERKVMEVRSFLVENKLAEVVCAEYADQKMAKVKEMFPDYYELLDSIDANGTFRTRTTGKMVRNKIDKARARRAERDAKQSGGGTATATVPSPRPAPDPEPETEQDTIPNSELNGEPEMTEDQEADQRFMEGMARVSTTPGEFAEMAESMGERADFLKDPELSDTRVDSQPITIPSPDEVLHFGDPEPDSEVDRPRAIAFVIAFLAGKGPGFEFQPHEVAVECMEHIGRSAGWYRQEISTTLAGMGLVLKNKKTDKWTVADDIRSSRTQTRIQEFLEEISPNA
jgi:hypothetical protein